MIFHLKAILDYVASVGWALAQQLNRQKWIIVCLNLLVINSVFANKIVNVYAWGGEIPKSVIQQFEHDTQIHVNFSTYDSNETMYAKLRSSKKSIYDVILPSAYFVERMKKQGMLNKLDHSKLTRLSHIDIRFTQSDYDQNNQYSIPLIWGATGIFYNQHWVNKNTPKTWAALWDPKWRNQLMLLDDSRELFAMSLMSLNYSPNDTDPAHIHAAYEKLLTLIPNIKFFGSEGIQAVVIDEDAIAGTAWNGDAFKAHAENKDISFVYPKEGFVIWIDCLAMPVNPPHPNEAYEFINYMLKPEVAAKIAQIEGHAITNRAGKQLLPKPIRDNVMIYPSDDIMKNAHVQRDVGEETIALYNQYWQAFKLAF